MIVSTVIWWILGIVGAAWFHQGQHMDVPAKLLTSLFISWSPVVLLICL